MTTPTAQFNASLNDVFAAADKLLDRACTVQQARDQAQQLEALIAAAQAALAVAKGL